MVGWGRISLTAEFRLIYRCDAAHFCQPSMLLFCKRDPNDAKFDGIGSDTPTSLGSGIFLHLPLNMLLMVLKILYVSQIHTFGSEKSSGSEPRAQAERFAFLDSSSILEAQGLLISLQWFPWLSPRFARQLSSSRSDRPCRHSGRVTSTRRGELYCAPREALACAASPAPLGSGIREARPGSVRCW